MSQFSETKKYSYGPGDPVLPPQLAGFQGKSADDMVSELNKIPFFMTKIDNSNENNVELEALKALAYEGEPNEIAENFKNQGNELYKVKRYKDARVMYRKALSVNPEDVGLKASLYLNCAACELELRNFKSCIKDAHMSLRLNPKSSKAYYRISKSLLQLNKYKEAIESARIGMQFDPDNFSLQDIIATSEGMLDKLKIREAKRQKEQQEEQRLKSILKAALVARNITQLKSNKPSELLEEVHLRLENPEDIESQLILPAMVFYPTTEEFDFVASVSEVSTPRQLLDMLLQRPKEWFEQDGHQEFTTKKLVTYMETENGGLVKVGKNLNFHNILCMEKPVVPLFDGALRIYFVPKSKSDQWIFTWNKTKVL